MENLINKIHLGDCLEFMKQLPDKCIDLVLTDPPYGIGENSFRVANRGKLAKTKDYGSFNWDKKIPEKAVFDEIFRVSKNQVIWGGNYFTEYLRNSKCWLVWDKVNAGNDFADCELAYTSLKSAVRQFTFLWSGMLQENMKNKEERIHPTQKPVELFKWCIQKSKLEKGIILDCFSGSGTSAIAAFDLGFDFICVEKDPRYHAASIKRLEEHKRQMRLI